MSRSITRAKRIAEDQYASTRSAPDKTLRPQGWLVKQMSSIAGGRSLNEQDLRQNLEFFKIPQIESILSKLALKIFNKFANILKGIWQPSKHRKRKEGETKEGA
jgi:hypothetical protein